MELSRVSLSSTLMIVLTLFCITCIIFITYISLSETSENIKNSFEREANSTENLFSKSSLYIQRGLQLWDSSYNDELNRDIRYLTDDYDKNHQDPSKVNLSRIIDMIDPLYRDRVDLFLINSTGIIEYTTDNTEYLLDFKKWPDFYAELNKINKNDLFVPDEIVKGFLPGEPLRKFGYLPTSDHRYIAQISLNVQNDSIPERSLLSYGDLVLYVLKQNPDLIDLHVISSMHTLVIGKKAYPGGRLDPSSDAIVTRVFASHERVVISDPVNKTVTTYIYIPNTDKETPSSHYMDLVVKFIFSSSDLEQQLTNNFLLHLFLAISGSLFAILITGLISNRITSPINQLVREIGLIAEGSYDHPISPTRHPELRRISDAVQSMVLQISRVIKELKISEARYHDLFTTATDAILILEEEIILDANPAAISLFSKEKEQITGKPLSSLCHPLSDFLNNPAGFTQKSPPSCGMESRRQISGDIYEADIRIDEGEIGERVLNVHLTPLSQGTTVLTQMQIREITHRVEMEQKLYNLNIDLEQQVRERTAVLEATITDLDSFTYTVSHDLRAPLRAIDGNAHFLQEKMNEEKSHEIHHYIKKIHENIRKMDHLIDDLLKFSRMSRKTLEKETIDMNLLVRGIVVETGSQVHDSRHTIDIHDLPPARGDTGLIRQVMVNLISNAIKFGKKDTLNTISIYADSRDGHTWYHVQDTGIGFDLQYTDKIFDVFLQLNPQNMYTGTGVGLAIVKKIISRHGGMIRVYSEEGVGSIFSFTLD